MSSHSKAVGHTPTRDTWNLLGSRTLTTHNYPVESWETSLWVNGEQLPGAIAIGSTEEQSRNRAALIVQAVNSHDDLVEALRRIVEKSNIAVPDAKKFAIQSLDSINEIAEAALAKAKGE